MSEPIVNLPWQNFPITTPQEALASSAKHTFFAKTSMQEKIGRIFNDAMFLIAAVALLKPTFGYIPGYIAATSNLTGMVSLSIGGVTIMQIPLVVTIIAVAPKILLIFSAIIVARKILAVAVNHFVYIAVIMSFFGKRDKERFSSFSQLEEQGYECRRSNFNISGINYDAFIIGKKENINNGHWVLAAGGNGWIGESAINELATQFSNLGLNVVYVNGPGVARSSGFPTSYSIGAAQEAGMQFLEKDFEENGLKAKKILLYGTSLGGGAQAKAICNHDFKKDIKYMVWSDRSFDTLSNAAAGMVTVLAKPFFFLLGIELDGIAAARRLRELNITHLITQNSREANENSRLDLKQPSNGNGTDGVIPNSASLYFGLKKAEFNDGNRLKCYGDSYVGHNGSLDNNISEAVNSEILAFLRDSDSIS